MAGWADEYAAGGRGIPSSVRGSPSGAVVWALEQWPRLAPTARPRRALDVGCGTARNAAHLAAAHGTHVVALDASAEAVARARREHPGLDVRHADLRDGLPAEDGATDLVLDVFVSKHLTDPADRARLQAEQRRVLAPGGLVLVSLSEPTDGYYGACPPGDRPGTIVDPATGVGSVLLDLAQLTAERADFELAMAWRKRAPGEMHGATYERHTLVTLWRAR